MIEMKTFYFDGDVAKIEETYSVETANKMIKNGWTLIALLALADDEYIHGEKPLYILVKC